MTDAPDLNYEDKPIWNEAFAPPPWNAVPATEHDDSLGEDDETYIVVCDGYDDEMPVVCAGTKDWPLGREQALILAASLDLLKASLKVDRAFGDAPDAVIEGAFGPDMLAALRDTRAAIAKAEGKGR